jgi:polyhydroxybutyrate depolymerase
MKSLRSTSVLHGVANESAYPFRMAKRGTFTVGALLLSAGCSSSPAQTSLTDSGAGGSTQGVSSGGNLIDSEGIGGATNDSGGGSDGAPTNGGQDSGGSTMSSGGGLTSAGGGSLSSGGTEATGGAADGGGGQPSGVGGAIDGARSLGCDASPTLNTGRITLEVDGAERQYVLKIPEDYDSSKAYRLIFGFHGRAYDADWVANGEEPLTGPYFGVEAEARGEAIFVAPQALATSWSNEGGRDIDYVLAMVSDITSSLCVDEHRIFATGFSYGAIMTLGIGCELGGTFRAIAPMSGSLQNGCPDSTEQVGYWASHGTLDTTISPAQGEAARDEFIARNHCDRATTPSTPEGCVSFEGCDASAPVSWCTFEGEHVPPPFAGSAIWQFFSQF